jgi:ribonuclease-3
MSILSNAFEAVLGAVYLDGGLESARHFLERFLYNRIDAFLSDVDNVNYKSRVLESSQRDGFGIPRYTTVEAIGPDHAKEFRVRIEVARVALGEGKGPNKKVAQQNAAREALLVYSKDFIFSHIKGAEKNELVSH